MLNGKFWIVFLLPFASLPLVSFAEIQKDTLWIDLRVNDEELQLNEWIDFPQHDSIQIEELKFYISQIRFINQENEVVGSAIEEVVLIDAADPKSLGIPVTSVSEKYDRISFFIGIDSITNTSGVYGGDLDPTNGMYWTWQSGYINYKLEGISPTSSARKNKFQYHIGGYSAPYNTLQKIILKKNMGQEIKLLMNLDVLLSELDFKSLPNVMSPNDEARNISALFGTMFEPDNED